MKFALLFLIVLYMSLRQMRISFVSCQNSNMCAGRPEDFRLIDPETCDRFYRCSGISNVGPLLIDCPPNMWFDPDIQECNFPDAFVCHIYADVEPGIECPSEENPFKVQFIPSMIDCERYYICYHERPIAMRCLEGFYWNQARQMCDNPIDANCSLDPTPTPVELVCRRSTSGQRFVEPHPTECELYYYCLNGVAQVQQCPFMFHFDYQEQACRIRDQAQCFANRNKNN